MKFSIIICLLSSMTWAQQFHTEFAYENKNITIQNSYPKGGQKYIASDGKPYTFVVFWSRITNKTNRKLKLALHLPNDAFTLPSSPQVNFYFYVPNLEMTFENESLSNYGLDLESYLNENWKSPSNKVKTILPRESFLFYHVALSDKGVNGVVRAGFELQENTLFYKINDLEINCGDIKFLD